MWEQRPEWKCWMGVSVYQTPLYIVILPNSNLAGSSQAWERFTGSFKVTWETSNPTHVWPPRSSEIWACSNGAKKCGTQPAVYSHTNQETELSQMFKVTPTRRQSSARCLKSHQQGDGAQPAVYSHTNQETELSQLFIVTPTRRQPRILGFVSSGPRGKPQKLTVYPAVQSFMT